MGGQLFDTYAAALQHDLAELPTGVNRVGVVRRATPWFYAAVDENVAALGPPEELLEEVKSRHEALTDEGVADAPAHNRAMDEVDYDARYRAYLDESQAAEAAIERIETALRDGQDIALVCYENTEHKRCHRTILRERIEQP